jgi:hypothetical protein
MGIPVGTVRSRLSRARARLRTLADQRLAEEKKEKAEEKRKKKEPRRRRGEVQREAAFAALPFQEFQEDPR